MEENTKKRCASESIRKRKLHHIISKTISGGVSSTQESKVWVFKSDSKPTMMKGQGAIKKILDAAFFRSTGIGTGDSDS